MSDQSEWWLCCVVCFSSISCLFWIMSFNSLCATIYIYIYIYIYTYMPLYLLWLLRMASPRRALYAPRHLEGG
jgi:hypothetical protein